MGWMDVATPFKWFEDCCLSPILGWNLTAGMETHGTGTRYLLELEHSVDRETACLEDGCEESHLKIRQHYCSLGKPGERQIPDSWDITFCRRWVHSRWVSRSPSDTCPLSLPSSPQRLKRLEKALFEVSLRQSTPWYCQQRLAGMPAHQGPW